MRRLRWRLFATFLAFVVLCVGVMALFAWWELGGLLISQTETHLRLEAQLIRDRIDLPPETTSNWANLDDFCRQVGQQGDCRVTVIRADGQVVGESHHDAESMQPHADRPEVRQVLADGQPVGIARRFSYTLNEEMLYVAIPLEREGKTVGVVRTSMSLAAVNASGAGILARIGGIVALVIVLAGALAVFIVRRLNRPLEEIRRGAQRFAAGDLAHRLYVPGTEEYAGLAEALNRMASQLGEQIRAITQQKTRQEAILASMTEGVVAVDRDGRILSLNDAAARLLAIDGAGSANRPLNEVVRNAQLEKLVAGVLAGGGAADAELILRVTGGEEPSRIIRVYATPLRDAEDRGGAAPAGAELGALLVLNDATQLRRLERVRQDFVANVSHELKTPITSIKGFVETLRDGAIDDPDKARHFLQIIANQADRLDSIITDLLSLSRIEQDGKDKEIPLEVGPIEPVLRQATQSRQAAADAKNIVVQVNLSPANLSARVNAPLLEQAVGNLLDNAIKYSEPGQTVWVEAAPANPAGSANGAGSAGGAAGVDIRVRDQGCGISAEHLPRLFERFYRVDKARSRKLGGTGLGLAIVKHIVSAHRGTVTVVSAPGAGSTFTIHLPG